MKGLVDAVRAEVSPQCLSDNCRRDGCRVSLEGAPSPRLIIDFDKPGSPLGKNQKRPDYLFIAESGNCSLWVVPLELKKGRLDVSQAIAQLQAGARAAEGVVPENTVVHFRPVVAHKGVRTSEIRAQRKNGSGKIRFRGRSEALRWLKCGSKLTDRLRS